MMWSPVDYYSSAPCDLLGRLQPEHQTHCGSAHKRILQLSKVVKFYLEKSVHGGFGLQCVHIYKRNGGHGQVAH